RDNDLGRLLHDLRLVKGGLFEARAGADLMRALGLEDVALIDDVGSRFTACLINGCDRHSRGQVATRESQDRRVVQHGVCRIWFGINLRLYHRVASSCRNYKAVCQSQPAASSSKSEANRPPRATSCAGAPSSTIWP